MMQRFTEWLLVFATVSATVLCAKVEDEELDPFDMVNFDPVKMTMKNFKKRENVANEQPKLGLSPTKEQPRTGGGTPEEEKVLESTQDILKQCKEEKMSGSSQDEKLMPLVKEQETETRGSCPALSLYQQHVSRLLRFVSGKVSQMDEDVPTTLYVELHLTYRHVETLESFKKNCSRDSVFSAHDILTEAVQDALILSPEDPALQGLWVQKYLGVPVDTVLKVLNFIACVIAFVVLLPKIQITLRLLIWIFIISFGVSVAMTWNRLFLREVAKQHAAMVLEAPAGCSKPPESSYGILMAIASYVTAQVTFQHDACVDYYERVLTDPRVMVTPMEAVAVATVQTLLKPLRIIGTEISEFLRALLKDLPVQWQIISLLILCGFMALILLLICGYQFRSPFISLEPSHQGNAKDIKALEDKICRLQAIIENKDAGKQPLPLLGQCHTVGSLPPNALCGSITTGPAGRSREDVSADFTCPQSFRSPGRPPPATQMPHHCLGKQHTSRTDVRQTAESEDEEGIPISGSDPSGGTVGKCDVEAESKMVPSDSQPGCACKEVKNSASASATTTPDAKIFPDRGRTDRGPEILGAVGEVGQSGDASTTPQSVPAC